MKVSLNWIKQYTDVNVSVDELVQKIGAQLGEIDGVENLGQKYQGVVIAKVITCVDHPGADRLHVCTIDDGGITPDVKRDENGYVQVVCGAPNVREGLMVAWLPPGSTVPESVGKEPFVLDARELRGVVSNGMLASPRELALSDAHEGILEIDAIEAKPGDDFAKVYQLDDHIIDIENKMFTHRPDCFGLLGVAREISGIQQLKFSSPDWYTTSPQLPAVEQAELKLAFRNELPAYVPRFTAVTMGGIVVKPSPVWLQSELGRLGIRPINNVVDITNYYMMLTGQPLHAYDYDKVAALSGENGATLVVRNPRSSEQITLLNGKTIDPRQEAIMIATDKQLIGVGGVMGGAETEVDNATSNIILEVATFDMYSIRRTAMAHGLFTDAVTRFNKGQSPLQNLAVLVKAVSDIQRLAEGKVASAVIDDSQVKDRVWVHPPVPITAEFINARLGLGLSALDMKSLLENVECAVELDGEKLIITAPFWRTDIETREDVVEEIGRLYGYDKLPLELPQRSILPAQKDELLELKALVRAQLAASGANEVLTYSFVHGNLLKKAGQDPADAFELSNALSPDLQYYRLSMTPSLLDKVHPNIKAGYDEFVLFEMGKGHNLMHKDSDNGLPMEFEMLEVIYAANAKTQQAGAAFYRARRYLVQLAASFGLELEFRPFEAEEAYPVVKPYDHTRSAQVYVKGSDLSLGMVGEYKQSVVSNLKLPKYCAGFGIGLKQLMEAVDTAGVSYRALPRFPKVTQDITLRVAADIHYQTLETVCQQTLQANLLTESRLSIKPTSIFQKLNDTTHKQITFRLEIASYEKTLTDAEVSTLLDSVALGAQAACGAERV